ncbi:MAG: hypothetical protein KJO07_07775, partial [Deltaproteobacteria bacterium]|nr:hypothetical protein [Deltaproteobacteria bacterium]
AVDDAASTLSKARSRFQSYTWSGLRRLRSRDKFEQERNWRRKHLVDAQLDFEVSRFEKTLNRVFAEAIATERTTLVGVHDEYARLFAMKTEWALASGGPAAESIRGLDAEKARLSSIGVEIDQALERGRLAYEALAEVAGSLKSASNWGLFDIMGGGLIATVVKHSKIGNAKSQMAHAQQALGEFQKELNDVGVALQNEVEIGSISSFGDFVFDGLVFDFLVQSKINRSRESVKKAMDEVEEAGHGLMGQREQLMAALDRIDGERRRQIESL